MAAKGTVAQASVRKRWTMLSERVSCGWVRASYERASDGQVRCPSQAMKVREDTMRNIDGWSWNKHPSVTKTMVQQTSEAR